MPAWSARLSSSIAPHYAVAIASSNLWPGAHTFTIGKYVGRHGEKHHGHGRVLTSLVPRLSPRMGMRAWERG